MSMSGFDAYKTYLAVNNHFKNKSYDYFKYNGVVKAKEDSYLVRKDKYFFEKAARRFKQEDFVKYLVANMVNGTDWIGELLSASNELAYMKWRKRIESLTYNFEQEIDYLNNQETNFNKVLLFEDKQHPLLFRMFLRKRVSLETMVLLEHLVNYSKSWGKREDMMVQEFLFMMKKYQPFFFNYTNIDKKKFSQIVLSKYS